LLFRPYLKKFGCSNIAWRRRPTLGICPGIQLTAGALDDAATQGRHPEEPCEAWRLEGWTPARPCLWPSFETRESKSAVADFDTIEMPKSGRPDFGARSSG
jgi:hypothetical protein